MDDNLEAELKAITGWSANKINIEISKLKCDYYLAKDVFLASGRFPSEPEQIILNNFGFQAWYHLFQYDFIQN